MSNSFRSCEIETLFLTRSVDNFPGQFIALGDFGLGRNERNELELAVFAMLASLSEGAVFVVGVVEFVDCEHLRFRD